ncbi:hypothetical protein DMNBHIDG_01163 [Candidatus Methanoperedenaceae archaeon GB37]|nr:hypothetical protein DMNBHIDG_01163 [Candidatus Methanoperedenaceae archaeon GB37]
MNSKTIVLNKEKETKNTIRYREETEGQPPVVQTIYIQKWFTGSPAPEKIRVTIEPLS